MANLCEDGSHIVKEWILSTKAIFITKNTILAELIEDLGVDLQDRLDRKESEGSGWTIHKIVSLEMQFYKTGFSGTKRLGEYCPWPKKCPGLMHIVNIKAKNDNCGLPIFI